jgi:hypothetical protein
MERRRALAWAGSITLTACTSVIVLGPLVGGFGRGAPPAQEMEVTNARPTPGRIAPGPTPGGPDSPPAVGGTDSGPATEGTDAEPASGSGKARQVRGAEARRTPGRVPAVWHYAPPPAARRELPAGVPIPPPRATTSFSETPVPQRDLIKTTTSAVDTRAVAPRASQLTVCDVAVGTPAQPSSRSPWQPVATAPAAGLSGTPGGRDHRAQHVTSVLGQSPGGGTKTAAEKPAVKVRSDDDG